MDAVVGPAGGLGDPAQAAIEAALLYSAPGSLPGAAGKAANRFAALAPNKQHAWLAAHLVALRSGHIALAQIP